MGSINDEIGRLEDAKILIKSAIEECGVSVPEIDPKTNENMKINKYAEYISFIPSAVLSNLNVGPIGDDNHFIKIIEQTNGLINVTLGGTVSTSSSGLVPKIDISDLDSITPIQLNDLILTTTSDYAPVWKKFLIPIYTGATSTSDGVVGLVPSCPSNRYNAFLRGDGTWTSPSDTKVTNNTTTSKYYLTGSTSNANTTGTLVKRSTVYVDTDGHLYDNSIKVATEDYVNNKILDGFATNDAMVFKGTLGTNGTITSLPTSGYSAGWTYKVATAGTYAGQSCGIGDMVICVNDGPTSGASTINSDWSVVQNQLDLASASVAGIIKVANVRSSVITTTSGGTTSSRYYGVELDSNGKAFVNIPWTNTTYGVATTEVLGLIKIAAKRTSTPTLTTGGTTTGRYYGVELDNNNKAFVHVPWTNTNYYPTRKYTTGLQITNTSDSTNYASGNIYVPIMTTATSSAAGTSGLVPAPAAGKQTSFLRGDGTWVIPTNTKNTAGNTTTTSKLYLVGTTTTSSTSGNSVQTYVNSNIYSQRYELYTVWSSGDYPTGLRVKGQNYELGFEIGEGHINRGIYDYTNSNWIIYKDSTNNVNIPHVVTTNTIYVSGTDANGKGHYTGTRSTSGVRVVRGSEVWAYGGFYESSDNKLKNFKEDVDVDLEKLRKLSKKYFTWKSDETNKLNIGTSAQELQELYPELVKEEDGILHVAYDKLSIIALKAIDKLYEKIKNLENKLK